jgi:hypothetical protein
MVRFKRLDRLAYGKPKSIKGAGTLIDTGSSVGTRIVRTIYFKPVAFGLRGFKKR